MSRLTQRLSDVPALTGLRGVAALWVLLYHAWVAAEPRRMLLPIGSVTVDLTPVFSGGGVGVDLFFVLSAFLLTLPFAVAHRQGGDTPHWRDYLQRRVLRILPAYYAQLVLLLAFVALTEGRLALSPSQLAAHAVLWLNLGPQPVAPLVGVWWTLPIEFGYYLALPVLVPWLRPGRLPYLIAAAIALTFAYRYGMFLHAQDRSIGEKLLLLEQLPGRLDQFVIGSATAVWVSWRADHARQLAPWPARLLLLGGVALVGALVWLVHVNTATFWNGHALLFCFHLLASVGFAAIIVAACSERIRDLRILRSRPLLFVGTISYSLYLWHALVLDWLGRQDWLDSASPYPLPALLLVGGCLSLGVAWLSWHCVEAPCLRLGRSGYGRP